jgi:O-acetyl-ADP-ribose deacetylase (regulator of RNase III)
LTGVFAVPKQLCADMYVFAAANFSSIRRSTDCPKELHIVDIDTSILRLVEESVKRWKKDPESLNQRITLPVFLKDNPHLANDSKRTTTDQSRNDEQDKNFEGDRKREGSLDLANTIRKLKDESFSWGGIAKQYMLNDQFVVKIYQGDICKVKDMDAVVCGVDKDLKLSGKFADTMRKHGGHIYDKNHQKMVERQKNGPAVQYFDVYKCDGGRLEAKHVLHAVLKGVVEADVKETKAYQDCMASVLATVKENRWEKVAIPLIRTGTISAAML